MTEPTDKRMAAKLARRQEKRRAAKLAQRQNNRRAAKLAKGKVGEASPAGDIQLPYEEGAGIAYTTVGATTRRSPAQPPRAPTTLLRKLIDRLLPKTPPRKR